VTVTFKQVETVGLSKLSGNWGYSGRTHCKIQLFETGLLMALVSFLFERKSK